MRLIARKNRGKGEAQRRPSAVSRRRYTGVALAVAGVAALAGIWQLSATGWFDRQGEAIGKAAVAATGAAGLSVREIVVAGRDRTEAEHLLAALDVQRGAAILGVDLEEARLRIESLGWVRRAEVIRRLPDTIFVRVAERAPLALWQNEGRIVLIDEDGAVIQRDSLGEFAALPMVVGPDAPAHAAELIGLLAGFPEVAVKLEAAVRVSERRWNLHMRNGVDVRLPETGLAPALARLDDLQRQKDLLDRDVIAVDLRVPDRLIVRINPEAAPRVRQVGKDT